MVGRGRAAARPLPRIRCRKTGSPMSQKFVSRGFTGKRERAGAQAGRVPPGQHLVSDFPVLSAGPTPRTDLARWTFTIDGLVTAPVSWTWADFQRLPAQEFVKDISCVTKWTKLDTRWRGVSVDTLFEHVELDPRAVELVASCDGGETTNPLLFYPVDGQSFLRYEDDGQALTPEHAGSVRVVTAQPASLLMPHYVSRP